MAKRWRMELHPEIPTGAGGLMILGEKDDVVLTENTLISVTLLENLSWWRFLITYLLTMAICVQMKRSPAVLYSVLKANLVAGYVQTMTIFQSGKEMIPFRDRGAHGAVERFFAWVVFGGKVQAYFLSWKAKGEIPTIEEAVDTARTFGKQFDAGLQVRNASRPRRAEAENRNGAATAG